MTNFPLILSRNHQLALAWLIRLTLVAVLTISGVGKLLDSREAGQFLVALTNSNPVVEKWAADFIVGWSIIEIVLAVSLLHQRSFRIGLFFLSGILVIFSLALAMMLARDVPLDSCGCLGAFGEEMAIETALLRNLILLLAVIGCYLLRPDNPRSSQSAPSTKSLQ